MEGGTERNSSARKTNLKDHFIVWETNNGKGHGQRPYITRKTL